MKIKNYNPELGFTLNDLRMLLVLDYDDDLGCGYNLARDIIKCIDSSIKENTTYTFTYEPSQIVTNG